MRDAVTPRTLVKTTLYSPDGETVDRVAYDAVQPRGSIGDGKNYEREVIGFAEFAPYTNVGRHLDSEAFVETVESKASYVHWKPDSDEIDVLGSPPMLGGELA